MERKGEGILWFFGEGGVSWCVLVVGMNWTRGDWGRFGWIGRGRLVLRSEERKLQFVLYSINRLAKSVDMLKGSKPLATRSRSAKTKGLSCIFVDHRLEPSKLVSGVI